MPLLVQRGCKVKALSRNPAKARSLFGSAQNLEVKAATLDANCQSDWALMSDVLAASAR